MDGNDMTNAISSNDLQEICDSIPGSTSQELGLIVQDLRDCASGYQMLRMELRYVSIEGDKIIVNWNIKSNSYHIISINGLRNHYLIAKYNKLFMEKITPDNVIKYLKHLNDMGPEEYVWCKGLE